MRLHTVSAINSLPPALLDALSVPTANPFFNATFLGLLEQCGCVSAQTGWQPRHIWIERAGEPVFFMAVYQKGHSWGEFVFDQRWAQAYRQQGLHYYPKWITAVPFTPSVGPRWWVKPGENVAALLQLAVEHVQAEVRAMAGSGWHLLFADALPAGFDRRDLLPRHDTQFHWRNYGYASFDDFLARLKSRKRKSIRRERQRVAEQGVTLLTREGSELSDRDWQQFYHCYENTYRVRGQQPYLNAEFFRRIGAARPQQIMMVQALRDGRMIGAALCFHDDTTLYGRHWGALEEVECLHFEACFYQGIEYCIRRGLQRFDPGTQGEHKLLRGFEPVPTLSFHWIEHPAFRDAIARFLEWEQAESLRYQEAAGEWLPYRQENTE
ncbi:MAG: GNAT family N-acetyltransferase [Pseudomonadota bacterium]